MTAVSNEASPTSLKVDALDVVAFEVVLIQATCIWSYCPPDITGNEPTS